MLELGVVVGLLLRGQICVLTTRYVGGGRNVVRHNVILISSSICAKINCTLISPVTGKKTTLVRYLGEIYLFRHFGFCRDKNRYGNRDFQNFANFLFVSKEIFKLRCLNFHHTECISYDFSSM